jgi:hypothetical protein
MLWGTVLFNSHRNTGHNSGCVGIPYKKLLFRAGTLHNKSLTGISGRKQGTGMKNYNSVNPMIV